MEFFDLEGKKIEFEQVLSDEEAVEFHKKIREATKAKYEELDAMEENIKGE